VLGLSVLQAVHKADLKGIRRWLRACLLSDGSGFAEAALPTPDCAEWRRAQTALTYASLAALLMAGDDLADVDADGVVRALREAQLTDGAVPSVLGAEGDSGDVRFVYAALATERLLHGRTSEAGIDRARAAKFVLSCQSAEGGFGLRPGQEGHGGATFCAVASLALCGALPRDRGDVVEGDASPELGGGALRRLLYWLEHRVDPEGGFEGRPCRGADVCYGWWCAGALSILRGGAPLGSAQALLDFVLRAQDPHKGGFGKDPESGADPLHSAYALVSLAFHEELREALALAPVDPVLGIPSSLAAAKGLALPLCDMDLVMRASLVATD
jgi:geranylgeranyl transferase type-1 subunit beta